MTAYHGGKQRIGKKLAEIIVNESTKRNGIRGYCEPFCGMLGVYRHIPYLFEEKCMNIEYKAGDLNKSVIMMWKDFQKGWIPPSKISEKEYNRLKNTADSGLKGYVGHQYSFGGQYFSGYAPKYGRTLKNYDNVINKISEISEELYDVKFSSGNYKIFSNLEGYVIYCDPPYENSTQKYRENFDSNEFYDWCRVMAKNNIIFVSSYEAPNDFKKVYSTNVKISGISPKKSLKRRKRVEKLYKL